MNCLQPRTSCLEILKQHNPLRHLLHTTPKVLAIHESILDTVGHTPVVNMSRILPCFLRHRGIKLYGKLEYFNPLGSVKDRLAKAIICDAEASGALQPGMAVIEATSGNTGIALAMVCASKGYPLITVMAESYSIERRKIMRALGAKVVLTPASAAATGMDAKARELAAAHNWFFAQQFENKSNPRCHASTTGAEILSDFAGRRLDYWVTGYGTGGTFNGAGRVIRCARPETEIVLVEPEISALVQSGEPQPKTEDGKMLPHPHYQAHPIQGWTPNFIPRFCSEAVEQSIATRFTTVTNKAALDTARHLAQKEGIFCGISGGATAAAGIQVAEKAVDGSVILVMIPDTQERYHSTQLFDTITPEMSEEEYSISYSTPTHQYPKHQKS